MRRREVIALLACAPLGPVLAYAQQPQRNGNGNDLLRRHIYCDISEPFA
jgi:hypothetical protein